MIKQTGALVALEAKISALTAEAIAGVKQAPITQSARDSLIELAEFISQRTILALPRFCKFTDSV